MKIVCDCGNEVKFIEDGNTYLVEGAVHCKKSNSSFELCAEHDELFIECSVCGKNIHIWT